jgi:hypothetical protein
MAAGSRGGGINGVCKETFHNVQQSSLISGWWLLASPVIIKHSSSSGKSLLYSTSISLELTYGRSPDGCHKVNAASIWITLHTSLFFNNTLPN